MDSKEGVIMSFLRLIKYKRYQKKFCKLFVKKSKEKINYRYYLKHLDKGPYREAFINVAIYDVLDNYGFKRLVNGIYKLKRKKHQYNVKTYFLNRKLFNANYININSFIRGWGLVGEIEFINHKWLSKIVVTYTSNNSSETIIEYNFTFKKIINTSWQIHQFVIDEIKRAKKEWYFFSYANKNLIKKANCRQLHECDNAFFCDILQSYLCKFFYTEFGKYYGLPIEFCYSVSHFNKLVKEINTEHIFWDCYKKDKSKEVLAVNSYFDDRYEVHHYCKGKTLPSPVLLNFFSEMSMEFYLQVFFKIEEYELEKHMRKYLNSRKKFVSSKDVKWLINKLRLITEQKNELKNIYDNNTHNMYCNFNKWNLFGKDRKRNEMFIRFPDKLSQFEQMYKNNLEYLKSISSTQNDKILIIIAVATLIATIIGILTTVLLSLLR